MSLFDVPLFRSTEEAERYGHELARVTARDEFQTLVRTWMVAQLAYDNATNLQSASNLAFRVQTLREAVQAVLFPDGMAAAPVEAHELSEVGRS